jgi:hypothetical protein
LRKLASDELRADLPVGRRAKISGGEDDEEGEDPERDPEDEALHA